jgi:hypothetical protein
MMHDDDHTPTLPNTRAELRAFDALMLGQLLGLLDGERWSQGYLDRELQAALVECVPTATPLDVQIAMAHARRSGFMVRHGGMLYLERRLTPAQMQFVRQLLAQLASNVT